MRGKKIREVSSHVKMELMVGRKEKGGNPILVGVNMGPAYSDERKLLLELMKGIKIKNKVHDGRCSMSIEVLKDFIERSELVVVKDEKL
ncbi:hypothetical protein SU68_02565 [Thermosipho melanesiensis]|uniref:Uncharacterized protein n=5 Tax=Thermosipho melanesiensis TaxID=46541 RepID=A6LKB2_THEM4|nr:hypothetical protein [Thermosipho melanesiensis]ABR30363.1 hypothetical protein Tmel_0496 [Thermosipho melanesiensis BI429]ABR30974.1 hypothetical protein Tmel_1119 [Thermosipho melanesiensis BI429]APT74827.1 hypothetical protein BW47_02660 [Thermosipho melanesiensis]APT74889.1 hypothetical protein BW47_05995 [Thermosipho melanesiensis]OOC36017.1 hypothetical protein SU68_05765 [Thermosipho melanesiensis]